MVCRWRSWWRRKRKEWSPTRSQRKPCWEETNFMDALWRYRKTNPTGTHPYLCQWALLIVQKDTAHRQMIWTGTVLFLFLLVCHPPGRTGAARVEVVQYRWQQQLWRWGPETGTLQHHQVRTSLPNTIHHHTGIDISLWRLFVFISMWRWTTVVLCTHRFK